MAKASLILGNKCTPCLRYVVHIGNSLRRAATVNCNFLLFFIVTMQKSGFTTIINDFIVERVLMMNALIVALVSGGIGLLFGYFASHDMNHKDTEIMLISCGVTSVCLGFLIALLVLIILEAAVKSIYVCWAQAPEDFQQIHPDQFPRLYQAWMNLYPSVSFRPSNQQNNCPAFNLTIFSVCLVLQLMESSGHVSQLQGAAVPAPESGEGYNDLKKPLRGY